MNLPALVLLKDYSDRDVYLGAIYEMFKTDFVANPLKYKGTKLALKKHPLVGGKEVTFWHLISKGSTEKSRDVDIPRCERIKWPKAILDNCSSKEIRVWENSRNTKKGVENRICICYGKWEYIVILTKKPTFLLFWTAYPVQYEHAKAKMKKEYDEYKKLHP